MFPNAAIIAVGQSAYTRRPQPGETTQTFMRDAVLAALKDAELDAKDLQGHGIVTAAPTVEEATIAAIHLERLARANLLASLLGTPRVITPEEIERIAGPMVDYHVRWAYYSSLIDDPSTPANW